MEESIPRGKYPAKAHARKVASYLKSKELPVNGVIYLEGGKTRMHEDCDQEAVFRFAMSLFLSLRLRRQQETLLAPLC